MNREHLGEEADLQKIKALLKENNPVWKQTRLTALNMGFNGEISLNFIAESLGVSVSSVRRWFVTFRREGLDGVLRRGYGIGRPSGLDEEMEAFILPMGYNMGVGTLLSKLEKNWSGISGVLLITKRYGIG